MTTAPSTLAAAIQTTCAQLRDLASHTSTTLLDALTSTDVAIAENELLAVRSYVIRARELVRKIEHLVGEVESHRDRRT